MDADEIDLQLSVQNGCIIFFPADLQQEQKRREE
jgi:hypothetical protein